MAHMYPQKEDLTDLPYSELRVYELLEKLPDTFYIFHSVQWIKRGSKWKSTWKENDFLILNKSLGGLVLEVKGGDIKYYQGAFHQINSQTREESILSEGKRNDPLSQAIDGVYHYRRLIDTVVCGLDDRFPIEAAVWFSTSDISSQRNNFPLYYREVSGAILGDNEFKKGATALNDVFDFYQNRIKTHISDDEFKKILEAIACDFELIVAPAVRKGEIEHAFLKLTNEQLGLLDYISEQKNATIQGAAGTGKTLVAKEAARRFASEGRRVLFLCFNRLLYIDLSHRYPCDNVDYFNINTFISKFKSGIDTSNARTRAEALQTITWDEMDYDDVIIDEAQDFENEEILYFKDLVELKDGHFLTFYDRNQLVTTREVPEWIRYSECKLLLTKNCRNTREIALTSYNVIDVEIDSKGLMVSGEQPAISFVNGEPLSKLTKLIRELTSDRYCYAYSDIVILTLKTEETSILANVSKLSGIPILREKNNSAIQFTTSRKYKGLESKVVIIIDIDEDCFLYEENKRNFYVACSRAMQQLFLFVNADGAKIKAIASAIDSKSVFKAEGQIAMKTQARIIEL